MESNREYKIRPLEPQNSTGKSQLVKLLRYSKLYLPWKREEIREQPQAVQKTRTSEGGLKSQGHRAESLET